MPKRRSKECDRFAEMAWPFAEYVRHAWPGAWVNSLFRREGGPAASELILEAVAVTRWFFGPPPLLGLVSFVNPRKVKPTRRRGADIYGYSYLKAGFVHDGFTQGRRRARREV